MKRIHALWLITLFSFVSWMACGTPTPEVVVEAVPAAPIGLTVNVNKSIDGVIVLSWEKSTDNAVGYRLYRDLNETGKFAQKIFDSEKKTDVLQFVDEDAMVGNKYETNYYYVITAYNKDGKESKMSTVVRGSTKNDTAPSVPADVLASGSGLLTPKRIRVEWKSNKEKDLLGYRVFRSDRDEPIDKNNPDNSVSGLIDPTKEEISFWEDKNVVEGQTYYYTVVAYDREGLPSPVPSSRRYSARVLSAVEVVSPSKGAELSQLKFSWKKVEGAVGYVVVIQTQEFGGTIVYRSEFVNGTELEIKDTSKFSTGNTYFWYLFAYDESLEKGQNKDGNSRSSVSNFSYKP